MEQGGVISRKGLGFQDHVAAEFCLDMLRDDSLEGVWCENQDDITLLWRKNGELIVEFVQVKSNELDMLWSTAYLCSRANKKPGDSILEKSLANDRCEEKCWFRMVTTQGINSDLKILSYPRKAIIRDKNSPGFLRLTADILKKIGDFKSENDNDGAFWVQNGFWQVRYSSLTVANDAKQKLRLFLENRGDYPPQDLLEELYGKLLSKVNDAASAPFAPDPGLKRIDRSSFIEWFEKTLNDALHPGAKGSGKKMQEKMELAGIPSDSIEMAHEQRRYFRSVFLEPKYLKTNGRDFILQEVGARLHKLKAQLDSGDLVQSGPEFHSHCLNELEEYCRSLITENPVPLSMLYGCMYNVVDRCLHRFMRAS